jgi:hypothetical protein
VPLFYSLLDYFRDINLSKVAFNSVDHQTLRLPVMEKLLTEILNHWPVYVTADDVAEAPGK